MQQTRAAIPPACASQVKLSQADVVALPLADKTVDRAFLIAVLPLVPETQTALQQLHRVLKPGGLMLVSEELPAPEYVPRLVTERWARTAGFEVEGKIGNIFCYSLLCRKAV
jgi:ubiquinone/menaquinone biosynthesis C-methylase UbiE